MEPDVTDDDLDARRATGCVRDTERMHSRAMRGEQVAPCATSDSNARISE